ncbi:pentapeptide repeat-containing protein, partial [Rothia nasimurium]
MTEAPKDLGSPGEPGAGKKEKRYDLGFWLVTIAWGTGAFVYGWMLAGILYDREYWRLTFEALGWADWSLAGFFGCVVGGLSFWASSAKESVKKESKQLFRIVVAVLPALFLVSALAVLTLTLATYDVYWKDARQGIATAFAALIAAVGVVVSVAVSYKTGEENRLLQKQTEQQKLDAELIKSLNDRLHEIISRRYGGKPREVSASYFQLAALYRDWETLADNSELVKSQKGSQQRNILKLLFGVYQESDEKISSERSEVDVRTLNSVIQDIFPLFEERVDNESSSAQKEEIEPKTPDGQQGTFDLSYLDLRGLDLSSRELTKANLVRAHLEGANLVAAHLEGAYLMGAHLEGANLVAAHLEGTYLGSAHLEGASLV